jgi:hypothetical protein
MLDVLESLPLLPLFLVIIICGFAAGALVLVAVRVTVHLLDLDSSHPLPIRDALISSLSAMFALMVAFSAAGIWTDSIQARAAVQREANSIENIVAIAWSFPGEFRDKVHDEMLRHARRTIQREWPAMRRRVGLNEILLDRSNSPLVALITLTSQENSSGRSLPMSNTLIDQIVDLRAARLQREMIARGGVSTAQWLAMILIALGAMTMIAIAQPRRRSPNHHVERLCRWSIVSVLRPTRARSTVFGLPRSRADTHPAGDRANRTVVYGPVIELTDERTAQ